MKFLAARASDWLEHALRCVRPQARIKFERISIGHAGDEIANGAHPLFRPCPTKLSHVVRHKELAFFALGKRLKYTFDDVEAAVLSKASAP